MKKKARNANVLTFENRSVRNVFFSRAKEIVLEDGSDNRTWKNLIWNDDEWNKHGAVYVLKNILLVLRFQRLRLHVVKFKTNDQNINTASGIHLIFKFADHQKNK